MKDTDSLSEINSQRFISKMQKKGYNIASLPGYIVVYNKLSKREISRRAREITNYFSSDTQSTSTLVVGLMLRESHKHAILFVKKGEVIYVFEPNGKLEDWGGHYFKTNIKSILDETPFKILYINHRGINTFGTGNCDALCLTYAYCELNNEDFCLEERTRIAQENKE